MQKWEYATVPLLVHATKQILDNWGDDGWELVALVPGPNPETGGLHEAREGRVMTAGPLRRTVLPRSAWLPWVWSCRC